MTTSFVSMTNAKAIPLQDVPELDMADFQEQIIQAIKNGQRLACLCGAELSAHPGLTLIAVLAEDSAKRLHATRCRLSGCSFPSLTPHCPQAHLFEREIAEQFGVTPVGHPWLKPVRFHKPFSTAWTGEDVFQQNAIIEPGVMDFFQVKGEEVHEVAVGPVHAGVIEPGHFRFQCHGETVFHLEIALGYQHRGIEKRLIHGPDPLTLKQMESVAGDTTIAHTWAYCMTVEALCGVTVSAAVDKVRGVALELERLANHTGDIGALSGDVGFLPTSAFCGRIRGDWLNITAEVCGSRLGRDWIKPGGLQMDLTLDMAEDLTRRVKQTWKDSKDAVELMWGTSSLLNRFEAAGVLDPALAREIGLVGVAARACEIDRDVRKDHPFGPYRDSPIKTGKASAGRVLSRAWVRWEEMQESRRFILETLESLSSGPYEAPSRQLPPFAPETLCVSLVEGWRGEVLHMAITDPEGRFSRYKIVDPSFHNWFGLALALRGEQVSDFPLINKSFNLSYCGHDL